MCNTTPKMGTASRSYLYQTSLLLLRPYTHKEICIFLLEICSPLTPGWFTENIVLTFVMYNDRLITTMKAKAEAIRVQDIRSNASN